MTEVEALKKARKLIARPFGWGKHSYRKQNFLGGFSYCLLGAIHYVASVETPTTKTFFHGKADLKLERAMLERLESCVEHDLGYRTSLAGFNDARRTKKRDVLKIMNCAIDSAKKDEHAYDSRASTV